MFNLMQQVVMVFQMVMDMLGDLISTVTTSGNEILLIGIIVPLAFLGVNMFRKLLNL